MKPRSALLASETKAGTAIADCQVLHWRQGDSVLCCARGFAAAGDDSASERPEMFPAVFLRKKMNTAVTKLIDVVQELTVSGSTAALTFG